MLKACKQVKQLACTSEMFTTQPVVIPFIHQLKVSLSLLAHCTLFVNGFIRHAISKWNGANMKFIVFHLIAD